MAFLGFDKPACAADASLTLLLRRVNDECVKALRPTGTTDRLAELRPACTAGLLVKLIA